MREKHLRSLMCLVCLLLFFPGWIAAEVLLDAGLRQFASVTGAVAPPWLRGVLSLLVLGGVLLGLAHLFAARLHRRYPDSQPRNAAWNAPGVRGGD
jgi:hypothetical protein